MPTVVALGLIIPPFGIPDEPAHFLRAAAISRGHIIPTIGRNDDVTAKEHRAAGGYVDTGAADFAASADLRMLRNRDRKASLSKIRSELWRPTSGTTRFAAHSNTAIYPPLLYIVPSIAFLAAAVAHAPPILWLTLGRLADGLVGVLLLSWSIRRSRDAAPLLLLFASNPLCLFLMAGVSADSLMFPIVAVFVAILTRISARADTSPRDVAALAASLALIGAGKVAYLPLTILPPLAAYIADRRWSGRVRTLTIAAAATVVLWAGWTLLVHDKVLSIRPEIAVDPKGQVVWMLHHYSEAGDRYLNLITVDGARISREAVGWRLGWTEFGLPQWFAYTEMVLAALFAALTGDRTGRSWWLFFAATIISLLCALEISVLIYSQYNAVGAVKIEGVQGRYFTPLLMIVLGLVPGFALRNSARPVAGMAMLLCVVSSGYTVLRVTMRYWI